jgi:hypothetical protein
MTTYIYTLSDPRTGEVRYVGKTVNPKQRRHNHSNVARDKGTYKRNWINQLKQNKLRPVFEIVDEVQEDWKFWERYWIQQFKVWGFSLTNATLGGEGLEIQNQTSFKKGSVPWNRDTGFTKPCEVCGTVLRTIPSKPKATCSLFCEKIYRKTHKSSTTFKIGATAWNKGKTGYSTTKKGQKVSDATKEKLRAIAIGNTYRRKQVKQYSKDMKLLNTFESVTQAKQLTGIKAIDNVLNGRHKTAGGFIWQF